MKCQYCKKEFQIKGVQVVCSIECSIAFATTKKGQKEAEKIIKRSDRERKEEVEPNAKALAKTKRVFQDAIRRRDKDKPCISCGTWKSERFHAGHYKEATEFKSLIFDERNCHKQCSKCNIYLSGNLLEYQKGLVARLGSEVVEELEMASRYNWNKYRKYTNHELKLIRAEYSKKWR